MQRDFPSWPRRLGDLKHDVVHKILEEVLRECVDALGKQSLRPAIRDLVDADERWTAANKARWALEAEDFWEGVVECMRRMFAAEGFEFWSGLSLTRTRLGLRMRAADGRAVEIGSMITNLVDGLRPRLLVWFDFALLDDVVAIQRTGGTAGLGHRTVNITPAAAPRRPYSARARTELVWDGAKASVAWGKSTERGFPPRCCESTERATIHENPLARSDEFVRFMFRGCDPARMRWLDEAPPGYREGRRRDGEDAFLVSTAIDS